MKPAIIDIGEPVFVPCTDCGGRGFVGQSICTEYCGCSQGEMVLDMTDLATLAQNLSIAAGLCRAFEDGAKQCAGAIAWLDEDEELDITAARKTKAWIPGCQRPAP